MAKHKWGGKVGFAKDNSSIACKKCGCVRQYVGGFPTYFIDDNVYSKKAPPCDERLIKQSKE